MRTSVFLILWLVISNSAVACKLSPWSASEWGDHATEVYLGRVTSVSIPKLEKEMVPFGAPKRSLDDHMYWNVVLKVMSVQDIRFLAYRVLKGAGESNKLINIVLEPCRNRPVTPGAFVVLLKVGEGWFVKSDIESIQEIMNSLSESSE